MKNLFAFLTLCLLSLGFVTELSAQTPVVTAATELTTLTVKVTGVGCSTDLKTIGANVEKMNGVRSCTVAKRGAVTRFEVSYNPGLVCEDDIYQTIQDTPGCKNPDSRPYRVKI